MGKIVKYNKLIRDRIPDIVKAAGWKPTLRILKKNEFLGAVKRKVLEEAKELVQSKDKKGIIDEIVDIQELLDILMVEIKLTNSKVRKFQAAKRKKRGGFREKLFLIEQEKI